MERRDEAALKSFCVEWPGCRIMVVMAVPSEHVFDVQDFEREVVARSSEVPVLVDFWASWCGPCKMLGPVLERLADEFAGAFVLAKVNVDVHQEAAARHRVSGIPDVKLFVNGAPVAGFVGAQREDQVRAFLRKHMPSEADELVAEARKLAAAGKDDEARVALEKALESDPSCNPAHLELAWMAMQDGQLDAAREHAGQVSMAADEREAAEQVGKAVDLIAEAQAIGSESEVRQRLENDSDDIEAYFAMGAYHLAKGAFRDSLQAFLAVAQRKRLWRDQAARKAMLIVFGLIGARHPLSDEFRRELMIIY